MTRSSILIVAVLLSMVSCRPESFEIDRSIILDSFEMNIYEPSGLAYSANKQTLYTVSDEGYIYEISMTGNTLRQIAFSGDDFESITINPTTSDIYICEEGKGNLIKLNKQGIIQTSENILRSPGNTGLEGLTYDDNNNVFYMLKEKSDGLLIKYSEESKTITKIKLNFAYDYSGIFFNNISNTLWIVSDESKTLTQCTTLGIKIKSYELPISGAEGVVVNDDETEAFLVSDPNKKLYRIDLTAKQKE